MTFGLSGWIVVSLVPIGAYLLGLLRKSTAADYVEYCLARRSLNDWNFLAAFFGANLVFTAIFLVISYETARRGWWALCVPLSFAAGVGLLYSFYGRLEPYFKDGKTLHEAMAQAYEAPRIRQLCALWTIFAFVGMVSIEFYGAILLLKWCNLPILWSVVIGFILATVCSAFTVSGGLRGITIVDVFLDTVSLIGIGVFATAMLSSGSSSAIWSALASSSAASAAVAASIHTPPSFSDNLLFVFAVVVLFVPMPICALDTWQRGVAWKKQDKSVGPYLALGVIAIWLVTFVAMLAGAYALQKGWAFEDFYPFRFTLMALDGVPWLLDWLKGLIVAGFIAAIFSTADELLNCAAYAMLSDVYLLPKGEDESTRLRHLRSAKFYTGLFAYTAAFMAWFYTFAEANSNLRIQDFFNAVASTQVVFFIPLIMALIAKSPLPSHGNWAYWSMISGFGTATLLAGIGGFLLRENDGRALLDGAPLIAFIVSGLVIGAGHLRILWLRYRSIA